MANIYQLPKEINSKTEIYKAIHIEDFVFVLLYFMLFYPFQDFVHSMLVIPYFIFNLVVGILIFAPNKSPRRKNFQVILYRLLKAGKPAKYYALPPQKEEVSYEE